MQNQAETEDPTTLPPTAMDAAKAGHRYYYTGRRCKNGHLAKRYVISGDCVECRRAHTKGTKDRIKAALEASTSSDTPST